MSTDNVAGELVQLNETLQDIATSLRLLASDIRPEPKPQTFGDLVESLPDCPQCEPDMNHQKGYE